jgi:DNA-directed RNA polymerase alpha subunit
MEKGKNEMKIVETDLPARIKNALLAMGLHDIEEVEKLDHLQIGQIPNIGNKMIGFLCSWLKGRKK